MKIIYIYLVNFARRFHWYYAPPEKAQTIDLKTPDGIVSALAHWAGEDEIHDCEEEEGRTKFGLRSIVHHARKQELKRRALRWMKKNGRLIKN